MGLRPQDGQQKEVDQDSDERDDCHGFALDCGGRTPSGDVDDPVGGLVDEGEG